MVLVIIELTRSKKINQNEIIHFIGYRFPSRIACLFSLIILEHALFSLVVTRLRSSFSS
jgi:hypothetical protein